jgi:hypothetical protein
MRTAVIALIKILTAVMSVRVSDTVVVGHVMVRKSGCLFGVG